MPKLLRDHRAEYRAARLLYGDLKDVDGATVRPHESARRREVRFVDLARKTLSISGPGALRPATFTKPRKKLLSQKNDLKHLCRRAQAAFQLMAKRSYE